MPYEPHEYCLAFPEMPPDHFRRLSEDIRTNGLLHEIVLYEGKILDGRHRYRACLEHQIEPSFTQYLGKDPAGFVTSENASRRHLTPSQLGAIGANLAEVESERAKARMLSTLKKGEQSPLEPCGSSGGTAEIISKKLGIGENTVQRAIKVKKQGVPEVFKAVEDGKITVNEGARIVELKPHAQRQIVQIEDKDERKKALGTRLQQSRSKKALREHQQKSPGDAYVPGTPFVKRFLARAEMMLNDLVSEGGSENPDDLADQFMREMDWSSEPLRMQYQHCEKLFMCIARVHAGVSGRRAA